MRSTRSHAHATRLVKPSRASADTGNFFVEAQIGTNFSFITTYRHGDQRKGPATVKVIKFLTKLASEGISLWPAFHVFAKSILPNGCLGSQGSISTTYIDGRWSSPNAAPRFAGLFPRNTRTNSIVYFALWGRVINYYLLLFTIPLAPLKPLSMTAWRTNGS